MATGETEKRTPKKAVAKRAKTKAAKKTRRTFSPTKKAAIIAAVDAAPRGSKERVYKKYGVLQTQVSTWRTKGFAKKKRATKRTTARRTAKSGLLHKPSEPSVTFSLP